MVFNKERVKAKDALSLIVEGIQLNEVVDEKFIKFLISRYGEKFNVNVSDIIIRLMPKEEPKENKIKIKNGKSIESIKMGITEVPFIKFVHAGPDDFKNKKVILSSSNYDLIKKFIKK